MVFLLEQINTSFATLYTAIDLTNALILGNILSIRIQSNLFQLARPAVYFNSFYLKVILISPGLCHNLVRGDLDFLSLPQNPTLVQYVDDIMQIVPKNRRQQPL